MFSNSPLNFRPLCVLLCAASSAWAATAETPTPSVSPADALVEQERVRMQVRDAFEIRSGRSGGTGLRLDDHAAALDRIAAIGPPAVPFLTAQIDQDQPQNFIFCSLALARLGGAEAEAALRAAIARAEEQTGDWAVERKAYAAVALGVMGHADAVTVLSTGNHPLTTHEISLDLSALEIIALFTRPASVPRLHAELERSVGDAGKWNERRIIVRALGRLGQPESLERIRPLLDDPDGNVRRAAIDALWWIGGVAELDTLLRVLETEENHTVRYSAAFAIEQLEPQAALDRVRALLDTERSSPVRAVLYRIVARVAGVEALRPLSKYLGRADGEDRAGLMAAMRLVGTPLSLTVFRAGLRDPDPKVVRQAVHGLADLATPEALALLVAAVDAPTWTTAADAIERLTALDHRPAAARIAERLLTTELAQPITDPRVRERVYRMGDALAVLGFASRRDEIRAAGAKQPDGFLQRYLGGLDARLAVVAQNGDDATRWLATLEDPAPETRALALEHLARIGGASVAEALARRFGRSDERDGAEILRAIADIDQPASRALVLRVLTAPEFDGGTSRGLRERAAWAALRFGGAELSQALRTAVERRQGRDAVLLAYLAVAAGAPAVATLDSFRVSRLALFEGDRGVELDALDEIARRVRAGRSLAAFAVPPQRLTFTRDGWLTTR